MKYSKYPFRTIKEVPVDEKANNAKLLIRAGFVFKEMAGVYSFLPFGLRVLNKVIKIIEQEMDAIGGMQVQMSTLQKKERWEKTGRWDDEVVDNWFKTKLKNGQELGLAYTHEAAFTDMLTSFVKSYRDLPLYFYEFRKIYRNELRAKSGLMRGREFFWKAMYSFSRDKKEHDEFYKKAKQAYLNIFQKVDLGDITYLTFASGGSFTKFSHEFQTLSEAGEDTIYIDYEKNIAINKEVYTKDVLEDLGVDESNLEKKKAIEVGNIFSLGSTFSKPLDLNYVDSSGKEQVVYMGSYGIGISRLIGTIVETHYDGAGIIWPKSVAPFDVHLIDLGNKDTVYQKAKDIYEILKKAGVEVLWDDREISAGEKFSSADLIGIPIRLVISQKTLKQNAVEFKLRKEDTLQLVKISDILKHIK